MTLENQSAGRQPASTPRLKSMPGLDVPPKWMTPEFISRRIVDTFALEAGDDLENVTDTLNLLTAPEGQRLQFYLEMHGCRFYDQFLTDDVSYRNRYIDPVGLDLCLDEQYDFNGYEPPDQSD